MEDITEVTADTPREKLTALCDTDSKRLNEIADKSAPGAKRFTSAHEMYKSGELQKLVTEGRASA